MITYDDVVKAIGNETYVISCHAIERYFERELNLFQLVERIPDHTVSIRHEPSFLDSRLNRILIVVTDGGLSYGLVWGNAFHSVALVTLYVYRPLAGYGSCRNDYTYKLDEKYRRAS